jgi:hypothetical protein
MKLSTIYCVHMKMTCVSRVELDSLLLGICFLHTLLTVVLLLAVLGEVFFLPSCRLGLMCFVAFCSCIMDHGGFMHSWEWHTNLVSAQTKP